MIQLVAHDLIRYGGLNKWNVIVPDVVLANYTIVFGSDRLVKLSKAIFIAKNQTHSSFYEIKRYFQYVGILRYDVRFDSLTMNIFGAENIDGFLDGFIELKEENWKPIDLQTIGEIIQEILNDSNKELVFIRLEKVL